MWRNYIGEGGGGQGWQCECGDCAWMGGWTERNEWVSAWMKEEWWVCVRGEAAAREALKMFNYFKKVKGEGKCWWLRRDEGNVVDDVDDQNPPWQNRKKWAKMHTIRNLLIIYHLWKRVRGRNFMIYDEWERRRQLEKGYSYWQMAMHRWYHRTKTNKQTKIQGIQGSAQRHPGQNGVQLQFDSCCTCRSLCSPERRLLCYFSFLYKSQFYLVLSRFESD